MFDKDALPEMVTEDLEAGTYEFTYDGRHYLITSGLPQNKPGKWAINTITFRKLEHCD